VIGIERVPEAKDEAENHRAPEERCHYFFPSILSNHEAGAGFVASGDFSAW
jgi:hypothetical protein